MSVCNNCGMDMPGEVKFCIRCGSRVAAPVVSASVPVAPAASAPAAAQTPAAPSAPAAPVTPSAPVMPSAPAAQATPAAAQTPAAPSAPAAPVTPSAPVVPAPVSESASALTPFVQSGTATAQAAPASVTPAAPAAPVTPPAPAASAVPPAPATPPAPAALQPVQVRPSEATITKPRTQYTDKQEKTPGIGKYLGYLLLFNIPLIGWVICIVTAIASDNDSLKNLARAQLIFFLIIMALSAVAGFVIYNAFESIASFLSDYFGKA